MAPVNSANEPQQYVNSAEISARHLFSFPSGSNVDDDGTDCTVLHWNVTNKFKTE